MAIDKKMEAAFNDQINKELYSAYLYLDFSNHFKNLYLKFSNLPPV